MSELSEGLPTRYEPQATEGEIYARWLAAGCFRATPDATGEAVLHHDSAAQYHRGVASWSRAE